MIHRLMLSSWLSPLGHLLEERCEICASITATQPVNEASSSLIINKWKETNCGCTKLFPLNQKVNHYLAKEVLKRVVVDVLLGLETQELAREKMGEHPRPHQQ